MLNLKCGGIEWKTGHFGQTGFFGFVSSPKPVFRGKPVFMACMTLPLTFNIHYYWIHFHIENTFRRLSPLRKTKKKEFNFSRSKDGLFMVNLKKKVALIEKRRIITRVRQSNPKCGVVLVQIVRSIFIHNRWLGIYPEFHEQKLPRAAGLIFHTMLKLKHVDAISNYSFSSKFAYFRFGFAQAQLRFFGSRLKIPKPKKNPF